MLAIINYAFDGYQYVFDELRDQRTKHFFLLRSPFELIVVVVLYLKFVSDWGPRFMKNRDPFKLKEVLIVYNIFQILLNAYIVGLASKHTYIFGNYNYFCEPTDTSDSPVANMAVRMSYLYFIAKVIDLLDTIFFVLRKKQSQITFLHKFHHVSMCALAFIGLTYIPGGGHGILSGTLNCFIHVVMYFYYLVSLLDKQGKYTWWKKYLTQLQILQFFISSLHWLSLLIHPYCGYPKWITGVTLPLNTAFTFLFIKFYYKAYIKKVT